jgi:CspA family cold shock protein
VARLRSTSGNTLFDSEILTLAMGKVKWFNATKGYGFIQPDEGGSDVFVHISAVEKAGYTGLAEGARISYELRAGRSGKMSAENLRVG